MKTEDTNKPASGSGSVEPIEEICLCLGALHPGLISLLRPAKPCGLRYGCLDIRGHERGNAECDLGDGLRHTKLLPGPPLLEDGFGQPLLNRAVVHKASPHGC